MKYRRFGKTELQMPVISFGCMRSMFNWSDKPLNMIPDWSQSKLKSLIDSALSHGINHFETAMGYGSSERQLGELLQELNRHDIILQTKVAPCSDPEDFLHRVHQSLERLQVDRIDLLALHGINDHRSLWHSCRKGGCLEAARRLQNEGKVGHIGFSGHGPTKVILAAIEHEEDGGFDYLNLHYYFIFTANHAAIQRAVERDLGIYIISPTDKGGRLQAPPEKMRELCKPLSPMLFNDLFCLKTPGVSSISVGAAEPDQFDEHLKVLDLLEDKTLLEVLVTRLEDEMEKQTGYCRPDHLFNSLPNYMETPGHINIPFTLWLDNLARGWNLADYARSRYAKLGHDTPWVPGNNSSLAHQYRFDRVLANSPLNNDELIEQLLLAHSRLHVS